MIRAMLTVAVLALGLNAFATEAAKPAAAPAAPAAAAPADATAHAAGTDKAAPAEKCEGKDCHKPAKKAKKH